MKKFKPKKLKICPVCGKEFMPDNGMRVYCSDECLKEHHKQLEWKPPRYCAICGKRLTGRYLKYCGEECQKEHKRRMKSGTQAQKRKKGDGELSRFALTALAAKMAGLSYGNFKCLAEKEQKRLIAKAKAMHERGEKIE